ncbi:MAG TPA: NAD(P)H-dependent glycerol-3-phosphate dehydrogenase [Casimicrobiaceae bacterium]|nr:NAD(P)H-dependent glycerol-3-phosphate dehydrogenase [Casimicrobiaceae bacterium]
MDSVAILGAGAWGTALAIHLARTARTASIRLWARERGQADAIATAGENARYLPGRRLPPSIAATADLAAALDGAVLVVVSTPVNALVEVAAAAHAHSVAPLFWVCKGFVGDTTRILPAHQVVAPSWPAAVGVISGPSFADEVARGLPTAVTVAASERDAAERVARRLRGETFRAYVSEDLAGVEVCGAVKNVLAIAAGASDGLGFGHNARAALITRGLAETGRLCVALGGQRDTLMGLAGLGDLVLTCTGDLSRNRRVGLALARGRPLAAILTELGHVAEGVTAARHVHVLCEALRVEMPICDAVYRVLHEGLPVRSAVEALLAREPAAEFQ